jgi:hypothetical protein
VHALIMSDVARGRWARQLRVSFISVLLGFLPTLMSSALKFMTKTLTHNPTNRVPTIKPRPTQGTNFPYVGMGCIYDQDMYIYIYIYICNVTEARRRRMRILLFRFKNSNLQIPKYSHKVSTVPVHQVKEKKTNDETKFHDWCSESPQGANFN